MFRRLIEVQKPDFVHGRKKTKREENFNKE